MGNEREHCHGEAASSFLPTFPAFFVQHLKGDIKSSFKMEWADSLLIPPSSTISLSVWRDFLLHFGEPFQPPPRFGLWMACQSVPHSPLTFDRFWSDLNISLFEFDLRNHLRKLPESFKLFQFDYYRHFGRTWYNIFVRCFVSLRLRAKIDDHALFDCLNASKNENDTNYWFESFMREQ